MGFLDKMVSKAITKDIVDTIEYGTLSYLENTRSVDALVNNSAANYKLIIKEKLVSIKRGFIVFDEANNKRYLVKPVVLSFGHPSIRLYDAESREIGKVRYASKSKKNLGIYAMYVDGCKIGTLSRKISLRIRFELNFNGWQLDGNFLQNSFTVFDKNRNVVIKFNDAFTTRDTYVLEIDNRENEIIGLLLFMAVKLALQD